MRPTEMRTAVGVVGALWLGALAVLFLTAGEYRATPGASALAPRQIPAGLPVPTAPAKIRVVMLAHPRCPCTRASFAELDRLMAEVGDRAEVTILFVRPPGTPAGWEHSDTWEAAHRIPHATVEVDVGGARAAALGALTSGQVVAYDADGRLRFSGGITGGRGHEGDNDGEAELRRVILEGATAPAEPGPVYGCPLSDTHQPRGGA